METVFRLRRRSAWSVRSHIGRKARSEIAGHHDVTVVERSGGTGAELTRLVAGLLRGPIGVRLPLAHRVELELDRRRPGHRQEVEHVARVEADRLVVPLV